MSTIAEFTVAAEAFALSTALEAAPGVAVEVERLSTHSREWVMPFIWASGDDRDEFDRALADDPSVEESVTVDDLPDATLYNVRWRDRVESMVDTIIDQHATILVAKATDGRWWLRLRFVDREQVDGFREYFDEHGPSFDLKRVYESQEARQAEFDLTPLQHETLVTALRSGYFEVPRRTTMPELADQLDISSNALSKRLRRAHHNLVRTALTVDVEQEE